MMMPSGKTLTERKYILTRNLVKTLTKRANEHQRCRYCTNTRRGCGGCAEIEEFFRDFERLTKEVEE